MTLSKDTQRHIKFWIDHPFLDSYLVMIIAGALGHMRHCPILYSFSYVEVLLIVVGLQLLWPLGDYYFKPKEKK